MDWNHPTYDRDQWVALVNIVMSFPVLYKAGNFLSS